MSSKADLVIGLAMFARSLVACDLSLAPGEEGGALGFAHGISASDEFSPLVRRREGGGMSNDPGRSRPAVTPLPDAPYHAFPANA